MTIYCPCCGDAIENQTIPILYASPNDILWRCPSCKTGFRFGFYTETDEEEAEA